MTSPLWPPNNGRQYVRSEEFGSLLVEEVTKLSDTHHELDFVDAVATVFDWFTRRLNRNGRFINAGRFPTKSSFRAYIRQSLFNAARMARRARKKGESLSSIPPDQQIVDEPKLSQEEVERLLQLLERLEEPHKSVFHGIFFAETDIWIVAGSLGVDEEQVTKLYSEALDQLAVLGK